MTKKNNYIGLMSGTSMDGIDAALVSFEDNCVNLIATHSITIPTEIKANLKLLLRPGIWIRCSWWMIKKFKCIR